MISSIDLFDDETLKLAVSYCQCLGASEYLCNIIQQGSCLSNYIYKDYKKLYITLTTLVFTDDFSIAKLIGEKNYKDLFLNKKLYYVHNKRENRDQLMLSKYNDSIVTVYEGNLYYLYSFVVMFEDNFFTFVKIIDDYFLLYHNEVVIIDKERYDYYASIAFTYFFEHESISVNKHNVTDVFIPTTDSKVETYETFTIEDYKDLNQDINNVEKYENKQKHEPIEKKVKRSFFDILFRRNSQVTEPVVKPMDLNTIPTVWDKEAKKWILPLTDEERKEREKLERLAREGPPKFISKEKPLSITSKKIPRYPKIDLN